MKRIAVYALFILLLASCTQPAPMPPTLTPFPTQAQIPLLLVSPTAEQTGETEADITGTAVVAEEQPTEEAAAEEDAGLVPVTLTPTSEPTVESADATQENLGVPEFDPRREFGSPNIVLPDNGDWSTFANPLPDTDFIRISVTGDLYVTGKVLQFATQWFTWPSLTNGYVEMKVRTEQCEGKDAYGLVVRGGNQGDPGMGYIIQFSCDGMFAVTRLKSVDPYSADSLLWWNETTFIRTGANKNNVMGVYLEGNGFSIYANGHLLTPVPVYDDTFKFGRIGVYVNAWETQNFTYRISEINVWRR